MIVVLFESSITPGFEALGNVYGLIIGKGLRTDEPGALHNVDQRQQSRKKPSRSHCWDGLSRESRQCGLGGYRRSHSGPLLRGSSLYFSVRESSTDRLLDCNVSIPAQRSALMVVIDQTDRRVA